MSMYTESPDFMTTYTAKKQCSYPETPDQCNELGKVYLRTSDGTGMCVRLQAGIHKTLEDDSVFVPTVFSDIPL